MRTRVLRWGYGLVVLASAVALSASAQAISKQGIGNATPITLSGDAIGIAPSVSSMELISRSPNDALANRLMMTMEGASFGIHNEVFGLGMDLETNGVASDASLTIGADSAPTTLMILIDPATAPAMTTEGANFGIAPAANTDAMFSSAILDTMAIGAEVRGFGHITKPIKDDILVRLPDNNQIGLGDRGTSSVVI